MTCDGVGRPALSRGRGAFWPLCGVCVGATALLDGLGPRDTGGLLRQRQLMVVALDIRRWGRGRIHRFQVPLEVVSIRAVAGQSCLRDFLARCAERLVGQAAAGPPRSTPRQRERVSETYRRDARGPNASSVSGGASHPAPTPIRAATLRSRPSPSACRSVSGDRREYGGSFPRS